MFANKGHQSGRKEIFKDVPIVSLSSGVAGAPMKFILARLVSGTEEQFVIRAQDNAGMIFHKDIKTALEYSTKHKFGVDVVGAGWLILEEKEKNIWLWGGSSVYDVLDYAEVKKLMLETYPDYNIIILKDVSPSPELKRVFSNIERLSVDGKYPERLISQAKRIMEKKQGFRHPEPGA